MLPLSLLHELGVELNGVLDLQVGPNVFVHGGLTSRHLSEFGSLEALNASVQQWVRGDAGAKEPTWIIRARDSPVWMRDYSTKEKISKGCDACYELSKTLELLNSKRMIVG